MRKTILLFAGPALLFASASAQAKDYGDAGTIELGGTAAFSSSSSKLEDDDNDIEFEETSTLVNLGPEVSYFVIAGLPVFAGIEIGMQTDDDKTNDEKTTSNHMAVGLGTGYLLPVGAARLGPALQVRYISDKETEEAGGTETDTTITGTGVRLGGIAKLPIGGGGVITAAIFFEQNMLKADSDGAEADITQTGFGTSVGVSVWF